VLCISVHYRINVVNYNFAKIIIQLLLTECWLNSIIWIYCENLFILMMIPLAWNSNLQTGECILRYCQKQETWHLGSWFSDGLDSVRLTVGLDDLKGLFQSKWFCDSVLWFHEYNHSTYLEWVKCSDAEVFYCIWNQNTDFRT